MTDPVIQDAVIDLVRCNKARNAMITIQDTIKTVIQHENGRGRNTSGLQAELMEVEESLAALRESGIWTPYAMLVAENQPFYDAVRTWMEANRREGRITTPPPEMRNGLKGKMVESQIPSLV